MNYKAVRDVLLAGLFQNAPTRLTWLIKREDVLLWVAPFTKHDTLMVSIRAKHRATGKEANIDIAISEKVFENNMWNFAVSDELKTVLTNLDRGVEV